MATPTTPKTTRSKTTGPVSLYKQLCDIDERGFSSDTVAKLVRLIDTAVSTHIERKYILPTEEDRRRIFFVRRFPNKKALFDSCIRTLVNLYQTSRFIRNTGSRATVGRRQRQKTSSSSASGHRQQRRSRPRTLPKHYDHPRQKRNKNNNKRARYISSSSSSSSSSSISSSPSSFSSSPYSSSRLSFSSGNGSNDSSSDEGSSDHRGYNNIKRQSRFIPVHTFTRKHASTKPIIILP